MVSSSDARRETDGSASTPAGWYAVVVLGVALILSFTDRLILNLVVDPIRSDLGLSDLEISLLQGAGFAVIFALAGLPCGRLADSVNRRNLIAAGVSLWSAATIACGLAFDFWSFFVARVAVGLGEAALVPAASSLIIDLFSPRRRGIALGTFSLGATLGSGAALFVGGVLLAWIHAGWLTSVPLIGALAPWRLLMILVGVPGFALLPAILVLSEPVRLHASGLLALSAVAGRLIAHDAAVLRVCLVKGVIGAGELCADLLAAHTAAANVRHDSSGSRRPCRPVDHRGRSDCSRWREVLCPIGSRADGACARALCCCWGAIP
ncbi:MAG: MFS transporter [Gammaproteobacteria bacterium]